MTLQATIDDRIRGAALALRNARESRRPCPRISDAFGIRSAQEAYLVQELNTQRALQQGRRLSGRKIGLTSLAVQQQLGVDQPDFGMLFVDMEIKEGGGISMSRLIQPKVEGEIAFVLGRDILSEDVSMTELVHSIDYLLPAMEIVDSAIEGWNISLIDTVADNASSALYVLGKRPMTLRDIDLQTEGMMLRKNQQIVSTGTGAACLGNPLNACLWLARTMVAVGKPLLAGEVLLSGALGPMTPVASGDALHLKLSRLGDVSCRFT
ncbi:2-keto-4-pentenoate hydratase [Herbaspirillum sp. NPDC087042]|uniref:2-keto-4-pentenoate hydratase n=1 Tax=Herbaspirillum sp. NPDC087042 TaxID=3364004 RepID=UPI0037FC01D0